MYVADEPAYIQQIKALGDNTGTHELCHVCVMLRVKVRSSGLL
jgi:hypothetical protein